MRTYDYVIIGAGITGPAVAREQIKWHTETSIAQKPRVADRMLYDR
ncbi:MAG: hypothetical protein ACLFV2_01970 [Desulfurivibrionaceae bacterium]